MLYIDTCILMVDVCNVNGFSSCYGYMCVHKTLLIDTRGCVRYALGSNVTDLINIYILKFTSQYELPNDNNIDKLNIL